MSKNKTRNIIIFSLLLLVLCIVAIVPYTLKRILDEKLAAAVFEGTNGDYGVHFTDSKVSIFPFKIVLINPSLKSLKMGDNTVRINFTCKRIILKSIDYYDVLFKNYLNIGRVEVNASNITVQRNTEIETDSIDIESKPRFDSISIGKISISDADFKFYDSGKEPVFKATENAIEVGNLRLIAKSEKNESFYDAGSVIAVFKNLEWTSDKFYSNKLKSLYISVKGSEVRLDTLTITPVFSKKEFASKAKYQTDRFDLMVPEIRMHQLDLTYFFKNNVLKADSLSITNAAISVYRDKNYIRQTAVISTLQDRLRSLPIVANIRTITISKMRVQYEELKEGMKQAGLIRMTNMSAVVSNIRSGVFSKDTLIVKASATIMKSGAVNVLWKFPLAARKVAFLASGTVEHLPLQELNSMSKLNAGIEIESGRMQQLSFSMKADHNFAQGEVVMKYSNLKVNIEPEVIGSLLNGPASFALNKFVIHEANPEPNDALRKGIISYPNNHQRFIFNYSWKALLTGIADIVMIKKR